MHLAMKIRDIRHKEKFQIDDIYLNGYAKICGIYATGVYMSLCRHANNKQFSFPSINKIAEELNISRDSVIRAIRKLEKHLIVIVDRPKRTAHNTYYLVDKSLWSKREVADSNLRGRREQLREVAVVDSKVTHIKDTHIRGDLSNLTSEQLRRLVQ